MTPLFPEVGVIGIVPDTWGRTPWQTRHSVLTHLSRYFHVVWVDPPRSWRQAWLRDDAAAPQDLNGVPVTGSFEVYRHGPLLPLVSRPPAMGAFLRRARWRAARRRLTRRGATSVVLYLWRPDFVDALDDVEHDLSVYHIDDEYSFSSTGQPISADELKALRGADQVVIHSQELLRKKGSYNPETIYVPNGVDFETYSSPKPEPPDLAPIPHPRIGYVGMIKTQLDWALLAGLADRHRAWSFVYVGPTQFGDAPPAHPQFPVPPNTYFLGRKRVEDLPAYAQHFDVCMMPYAINEYTRYIFPLKLNEYLATGQPVIGSPIATLLQFQAVVRIADGMAAWSEGIADLLRPQNNTQERIAERQAVARSHDWNVLVAKIGRVICQKLGPEYVRRFDAATNSAGEAVAASPPAM